MKRSAPLLEDQPREYKGTIERIIFHNAENGFSVLKVALEDRQGRPAEGEVMVGHIAEPRVGTHMAFRGQYVKNARFGRQFAFDVAEEIMPATTKGIEQYLASGLIKGIGASIAGRIVQKFGLDTFDVLDNSPQELLQIRGISPKKLQDIHKSWQEHRGIRDLLLFLQPHGISTAYGVRIYRKYGQDALRIVQQNPYNLAMDISGIGFLTADAIASKLGFRPDHPLRIQAAVLYLLQKASDDGHVFLPESLLQERSAQLVGASPDQVGDAIRILKGTDRIAREDFKNERGEQESAIYLKWFYHCESKIAFYLHRLLASPKTVIFADAPRMIADALDHMEIVLAPAQKKAVEAAAASRALVITGGPGTGKTTIIKAIIRVFEAAKAKILLAAPTGRAAKRMAEATGRDARTIHRLLEYSPHEDRFGHNEDAPLACGLLIIDEASMMDTNLFYHLLKAVPLGATLILVGDVHQLPSVGPGNVLGDIIEAGCVPVVELNEIFRQSAESDIICNAHMINRGQMPMLERNPARMSDFYFIAQDDPEKAADLIVDLIKNHIPRRFGLDPVNEVQLLTPMHKGAVGAASMNARLQAALNPNAMEIRRGDKSFRLHDKVMQIRNNYDKEVFNGDIGRITWIDPREKKLSVNFDGVTMPYDFDELDELIPAYAISIHKSQGSEYPAVVIPLMMQHYVLLQRNLIYTGVTRGKKLVVVVGEGRAFHIAVSNNKTSKRYTLLAQRLAPAKPLLI